MSLPFRHVTAEDYVQDTIKKLQAAQPDYTHLTIGNYFLQALLHQRQAPPDDVFAPPTTGGRHPQRQLDNVQLTSLLNHGARNPNLNELTFCNININGYCTMNDDDDDDSSTKTSVVLDHLVGLFTNGAS